MAEDDEKAREGTSAASKKKVAKKATKKKATKKKAKATRKKTAKKASAGGASERPSQPAAEPPAAPRPEPPAAPRPDRGPVAQAASPDPGGYDGSDESGGMSGWLVMWGPLIIVGFLILVFMGEEQEPVDVAMPPLESGEEIVDESGVAVVDPDLQLADVPAPEAPGSVEQTAADLAAAFKAAGIPMPESGASAESGESVPSAPELPAELRENPWAPGQSPPPSASPPPPRYGAYPYGGGYPPPAYGAYPYGGYPPPGYGYGMMPPPGPGYGMMPPPGPGYGMSPQGHYPMMPPHGYGPESGMDSMMPYGHPHHRRFGADEAQGGDGPPPPSGN